MIWYPPENESTPDTRKEGLRVIKNFFMSKKGTDFPPRDIKLVDDTDGDAPAVLDFMRSTLHLQRIFIRNRIPLILQNRFSDFRHCNQYLSVVDLGSKTICKL
jgi:hypothetical protein